MRKRPMSTPRYRYAIIGTGRPWKTEGATGFGMARPHWHGFRETERADLVAIADIREDNARLFLEQYESDAKPYADYREMLREEKPDIVSVTLWPHLHAEMTIAACETGVRAIHCEKPMATTWADAKRMKAAADANGAILTFNHQRRFLEPFQKAKRMMQEGVIGELKRIEGQTSNLYDWGTHWLDMFSYYNDDTPVEWVIGQIDSRKESVVFGAAIENQGICHFKWANGVRGLLVTGFEADWGAQNRLVGTEGVIEVGAPGDIALRVWGRGDSEWRTVETQEGLHGSVPIDRACADLVRALDEPGYTPLLSVNNALIGTEIYFAAYASSRLRARMELPLTYEGNAFHDMLASGEVGPDRN